LEAHNALCPQQATGIPVKIKEKRAFLQGLDKLAKTDGKR
jgi:hypothetical protein